MQAESPVRKLLRSAAQYSIGSTVTMLASIARVGVTARLLDEAENGIWLGLQLLLSYGGNLHLGTLYGLYRSVPMLRAKKDDEAVEREKETAFAFVLAMTVVGSVVMLAVAPRLSRATPIRHVAMTAALLVANLLRMYWSMILRAESKFKELSAAWVIGAVVTAATLPLIVRYKLDGVIMGMLAQTVVETAYCAWCAGTPKPRFHRTVLGAQLRVGLMTLGTTVGTLALTTADRTVMLRLCGAKATGVYYLGANISTLLPAIALIPAGVLTPQFFERVGRGEDITPLVERPLKVMAVFLSVLCGVGAAVLPATVHRVWPHHAPGIPAAQLAFFASIPIVLAGLVTNVFYALDRQGRHVIILALSAVAAYAFGAIFVKAAGGQIIGAVIGLAVASITYFFVVLVAAARLLPKGSRTPLGAGAAALGPSLTVLALLLALAVALPGWLRGGIPEAGVALVVALVGSAPFVPRALAAFRGRTAPAAP